MCSLSVSPPRTSVYGGVTERKYFEVALRAWMNCPTLPDVTQRSPDTYPTFTDDTVWHGTPQARTAADMALRLASKVLRPWVPVGEARRLLAEALPLVGALGGGEEAAAGVDGGGRQFVASVPPEEAATEVRIGSGRVWSCLRSVLC